MTPEEEKFLKYATPRLNYIFEEDFDQLTKQAVGKLDGVKTIAESGRRILGRIIPGLKSVAKEAPKMVSEEKALGGIAKTVENAAPGVAKTVSEAAPSITKAVSEAAPGVAEAATKAAPSVAEAAAGVAGKVAPKGSKAINFGLNAAKSFAEGTTAPVADIMRGVARRIGAKGTYSTTDGHWMFTGKGAKGVGNRLAQAADWLDRSWLGVRGLERARRANLTAMLRSGKLADRNAMRSFAKTHWYSPSSFLGDAAMLSLPTPAQIPWMVARPWGRVVGGLAGGGYLYGKGDEALSKVNDTMQSGLQSIADSMMKTNAQTAWDTVQGQAAALVEAFEAHGVPKETYMPWVDYFVGSTIQKQRAAFAAKVRDLGSKRYQDFLEHNSKIQKPSLLDGPFGSVISFLYPHQRNRMNEILNSNIRVQNAYENNYIQPMLQPQQ